MAVTRQFEICIFQFSICNKVIRHEAPPCLERYCKLKIANLKLQIGNQLLFPERVVDCGEAARQPRQGRQSIARGVSPWIRAEPADSPGRATQNQKGDTPMPQSFASLHFHIVFSTKNRQQMIGGTKSNLMRSTCGIERKSVALDRAARRFHQRQGRVPIRRELVPLAIHGRPCRGYCLPCQEQNRDPFRQPDPTYV